MKSESTFEKNLPRCEEYRGAFENFQNIANIENLGITQNSVWRNA